MLFKFLRHEVACLRRWGHIGQGETPVKPVGIDWFKQVIRWTAWLALAIAIGPLDALLGKPAYFTILLSASVCHGVAFAYVKEIHKGYKAAFVLSLVIVIVLVVASCLVRCYPPVIYAFLPFACLLAMPFSISARKAVNDGIDDFRVFSKAEGEKPRPVKPLDF